MDDICRGSISISFEDVIFAIVGGEVPIPRCSVLGSKAYEGPHQGAELSKMPQHQN